MDGELGSGEEEDPETLTLRGNLIVSGGEDIDFDYAVGVLTPAPPLTSVAIIAVVAVEGSVLVAVPGSVWNRKKAKRDIPDGALRKVVKVVVPVCSEADRATPLGDPSMTLWLGLLDPALEDSVAYDQVAADKNFPLTDGEYSLPFARALVAAANDHFSFMTAESGGANGQQQEDKIEARFSALEAGMDRITQLLQKQLEDPPAPRKSALKQQKKPAESAAAFPSGLDPVVAQQALQAGVPMESLQEIAGLMGKPTRSTTYRPDVLPPNPVEVSEDDEDVDLFGDPAVSQAQAGDPVSMAVLQMSKILSAMHREKAKAKDKSLEGILDSAESGSGSSSSSSSSRSRAAALRSLQATLTNRPKLIYQEVERLMQMDWERSGQLPGLAAGAVTARGWLEHRSRIQMYPSTIRTSWMIAGILDALRAAKPEEARARCCLALAAMDQQAADRGSWLLAAEVSLEPPPPFHSFQLHRPPEGWESPLSQLVDTRWADLMMSRLKDVSDYQENYSPWVARASKPHTDVSVDDSNKLDDRWDPRCTSCCKTGRGQSKMLLSPGRHGSAGGRQRELAFSRGGLSRAPATFPQLSAAPSTRRMGKSSESVGGYSVGRSDDVQVEGCERLPGEEEQTLRSLSSSSFKDHSGGDQQEARRQETRQGRRKVEDRCQSRCKEGERCSPLGRVSSLTPVLTELDEPYEVGALAGSVKAPRPDDDAGLHVPGAKATSVEVSQLWGALPRIVLKSGTSLASFLRSFLGNQPWKHRGTAFPLWPIAAPYPASFLGAEVGRSREELSLRKAVNLAILALSWLHLGRPHRCPGSLSLTSTLSSKQWEVVARVEQHLREVQEVGVVDAAQMGRSAAKVEGLENMLGKLHSQAEVLLGERYIAGAPVSLGSSPGPSSRSGTIVGQLRGGSVIVAKEIQTERLSLPHSPPSFDPTELLPPKHRRVFRNPLSHADPVDPDVDVVPKVRVHAKPEEVELLLRRLDATGRLHLAAREDIRDTLVCGAFALVKDALTDRLILDARPPNSKEVTLDEWCKTLASPFTLALKELEPHQVLYFSGTDLKDYYHAFKVSTARARRNVLAVKVPHKFAKQLTCHHPGLVEHTHLYPCLSALAMGDNQAVEIGQLSHIQLGLVARAFSPYELIAVHGRAPRGPIAAGIVIDDVVLAECAEPGMSPETLESVQRLNRLCEEYAQRGLLAHPKKTFRAQHKAEFWGCAVDGVTGHLRAAPRRLIPLMELTVQAAKLGYASVGLLETLSGAWISILQVRRRMLCLLQVLYECQRGRQQEDIIRLPMEAIEELYVLALLGPLAVVEMRAPSMPEVYMSDASEWGTASVRATIPTCMAKEFQRHTLSRGAWSKLLTPWKAWLRMHEQLFEEDELPSGVPLVSHPLWLVLAKCLRFEINHVHRARAKKHINMLELQSVLEVERRLAVRRGSCRYLLGADSQVTLAALTKGRSASPLLNRMLQQSLPTVLGSGIYGLYGFVPSLANPSDDPTRGAELRGPSDDLPSWWEAAAMGNFAEFDEWISSLGFDPLVLAELPLADESSICAAALEEDLLANLRKVQKPQRMERFLERNHVEADRCTDQERHFCTEPADIVSPSFSCTVFPAAAGRERGRPRRCTRGQSRA
eukprot:Skav235883  [mRNA]  locus=scaffold5594:7902:12776:+ [translate_table: standard]